MWISFANFTFIMNVGNTNVVNSSKSSKVKFIKTLKNIIIFHIMFNTLQTPTLRSIKVPTHSSIFHVVNNWRELASTNNTLTKQRWSSPFHQTTLHQSSRMNWCSKIKKINLNNALLKRIIFFFENGRSCSSPLTCQKVPKRWFSDLKCYTIPLNYPKTLNMSLDFFKTTLQPKEQFFLKWQVINSP
jgi:hypothetical protein